MVKLPQVDFSCPYCTTLSLIEAKSPLWSKDKYHCQSFDWSGDGCALSVILGGFWTGGVVVNTIPLSAQKPLEHDGCIRQQIKLVDDDIPSFGQGGNWILVYSIVANGY